MLFLLFDLLPFFNPTFFEQVKFNTNEFFLNGKNVKPILNVIKADGLSGYFYNNVISNNLEYRLWAIY